MDGDDYNDCNRRPNFNYVYIGDIMRKTNEQMLQFAKERLMKKAVGLMADCVGAKEDGNFMAEKAFKLASEKYHTAAVHVDLLIKDLNNDK